MTRLRCCILLVSVLALPPGLAAQNYVAGQTYFGRSNYIEYLAGNMPVILSAPHGGALTPDELPDRTIGTFTTDSNTELLAREINRVMTNRSGRYPHVILCRLDRQKIDCNRDIVEGAQGNALAEISWNDFQSFIAAAKQTVSNQFGRGFCIDLHGHGHTNQQLELGYLLSSSELNLSDQTLNTQNYAAQSSIRELDQHSPATFAELLRGNSSLGGLLAARGYPSVPSPATPDPNGEPYFNGGYNTGQHGSLNGGTISAVQIECNRTNVRDSTLNLRLFATNLTLALETYFTQHVGLNLAQGPPVLAVISDRTLNAGQTLTVTNIATDTDTPSQTFTFALTQFPAGAAVNATNGLLTWRPALAQAGTTNPFTVRVTDSGAPNLSATQSFTVIVNRLNRPRLAVSALTNGQLHLLVTGDPGPDYSMQISTNLTDWLSLFTTNSPALPFTWVDTNSPEIEAKFYRVRLGP